MRGRVLLRGPACASGTYLLRVRVRREVAIAFGGFKAGRPVTVPAGDYGYVGSALAPRGAASLGHRLLRHASRTGGNPPHRLRDPLAKALRKAGLLPSGFDTPRVKTLRWNIDHLLDHAAAELVAVIAARGRRRLEPSWARMLEADPHTSVVAKGLGAHDARGQTHLLRVTADEEWWSDLPRRLPRMPAK